jgi:hypothetical protein
MEVKLLPRIKLFRYLVLVLTLTGLVSADATRDHAVIAASGGVAPIGNPIGSVTVSFEEIIAGSPATVSIVIAGCKLGLTCDTLETYTTVANSIRHPTISTVYDYFTVTASWTGGTSVSVTVNTTLTTATNGSGGVGGSSSWGAITGYLPNQTDLGSALTALTQVWPSTPGVPTCTGTPCTAYGTTLTEYGSSAGVATSSDPGAIAEVPMVANGSHGMKPSASGALNTGAFAPSYTLPVATSSTLGGVKPDGTSVLNVAGVLSATAASVGADVSGAAATAQSTAETYATNASNIGSGTLAAGRLPNPVVIGTDNSAAGTLNVSNGSANAHTVFGSAATTTNTILGFATVPTNGHLVTCTVSSTTCTLTDGGAVPSAGVTSVFTRTGAVTATSGDYTLDLIASPAASVSFTAPATDTYSFLGTAPASTSSGTGTAAGTLFNAMAPTGGATTGSATTAGAGGNISYTAGAGGSGSGGTNASGGAGGSINLIPGVGGAKSGSGTAGVNGQVNIGLAGTIGGILGFAGLTSGIATCTAPAVAGTATNAVVCSNGFNVPQNSGTAVNGGSTPYYAFTGDTKTGMGATGTSTSQVGLYSNGNLIAYFGALATGMTLYSTSPIRWSDFSTFNDTYLCRASASVFEVGTTSCNALGTLNTGVINTGTSVAAGGFTAVSIGTPTQIYNTATTSSSASISATTMIANGAADRNYRFNAYVGQLAAGATCSVAGSIAINIVYTDPITGTAYTYVVPVLLSGGTAMGANVPLSTSTPTVANVGNATIQFRAKASTNVQFSTTYAQGTCSSGSPTYSIYPDLEAL